MSSYKESLASEYGIKPLQRSAASLEKELADVRRRMLEQKTARDSERSHLQTEINRLRGLLRDCNHPDFRTTIDVGRDRT